MSFLKKLKNFFAPKWELLVCRPADIIDLFKQDIATDALLEDLTVEIDGKPHHIGISSNYVRAEGYFNTYFFLDDQCFWTFEGFAEKATVDGILFSEFETITILRENLDSDELGDPRNDPFLAECEIVTYK